MMETQLTYGFDAKTSHLTSGLFYKDTSGKMYAVDPTVDDNNANLGLKKRSQFTAQSTEIDLVGMIHADIFCHEKFLLNGMDLKLKLHSSKNEFCLVSGFQPLQEMPKYKVHIMDDTLFVRSCKLNPTLIVSHAKELERGVTAKYTHSPRRRQNLLHPARQPVFRSQDRSRETACDGAYAKNPFNFKHFDHVDFNYVALQCNGETIPWKPLRLRFDTGHGGHIMAYQTLFQSTNNLHKD